MRSSIDKENMHPPSTPSADKDLLRRTRHGYRTIGKSLEDRKAEILRPGDRLLAESLSRVNELYSQVTRPQEATLDSRVLLSAASLAQSKARNIKKGKEVFSIDEFIGRLATFVGADDLNLRALGNLCTRHAIRPPTSDFILGPLQLERRERMQRAKEAQRKQKGPVVRPDALTDADTAGPGANSNNTTKTTIQVAKLLQKHSPIDLFSFIINPKSFSQSIENMFSLAFLVKEGRAGLYENEDGLQIVRHIDPDNPTQSIPMHLRSQRPIEVSDDPDEVMEADGWEERQQGIMTLDVATWEEAIGILELDKPIIPHRKETERIRGAIPL